MSSSVHDGASAGARRAARGHGRAGAHWVLGYQGSSFGRHRHEEELSARQASPKDTLVPSKQDVRAVQFMNASINSSTM
jgi:hypothetical protein